MGDFQEQIRGKIGRFRGIFAGKKSNLAAQSADFGRFSRERSYNSQKNWPILRDFSEKKSIFERFSGHNLGKSANFTGNFGANFAKKQSVKNSRFRWDFFGKFG